MKIVSIQEKTSESSAPYRLMKMLRCKGIDIVNLVTDTMVEDENIIVVKPTFFEKLQRKISINNKTKQMHKKNMYVDKGIPFSILSSCGIDISKNKKVQEADIIMINWLGGRFLSPKNIIQLMQLNKPIVFINHDSAHFTGGCHIRLGCEKYTEGCGGCHELHSEDESLTSEVVRHKEECIDPKYTYVVSPSTWMDNSVAKSKVFAGCNHYRIANPVNTEVFAPTDKVKLRKKYNIDENKTVILFGAVDAVTAPHKGYKYLVEAIDKINVNNCQLVIFGSDSGVDIDSNIQISYLGQLNEKQMVEAYNLADIYVFPSIDDNLPGTVLEASSCELPVVAFTTGGVPDIVDHKKTGYLAEYKNSSDLAEGIEWIINNNKDNMFGKAAREKMLKEFSRETISQQYVDLFNKVCQSH